MSNHPSVNPLSLNELGWRPFFQSQLSEQQPLNPPARVACVHGNALDVIGVTGSHRVTLSGALLSGDVSETITVGDWILLDQEAARAIRVLERQSVLARLAAGERSRRQLIAANIDVLFIVASCNDDFNPSRLERYLALALDARIEPVIVLTKADLCASVDTFLDQTRAIARQVVSVAIDATSDQSTRELQPWLPSGATAAFVGSSGVGKSTLINSLLGRQTQSTSGIREHDAKGRHTTTARHLFALPTGAWVIDTPGMRELKIGAVHDGIEQVFDDVESFAQSCRFRDCAHESEQGCAVQGAIESGQLDVRRLQSFRKLRREAARASMTTHELHERERRFGKMAKSVFAHKKRLRDD